MGPRLSENHAWKRILSKILYIYLYFLGLMAYPEKGVSHKNGKICFFRFEITRLCDIDLLVLTR